VYFLPLQAEHFESENLTMPFPFPSISD